MISCSNMIITLSHLCNTLLIIRDTRVFATISGIFNSEPVNNLISTSVPPCTPQYHRVHLCTIVYTPVPPCTHQYHRVQAQYHRVHPCTIVYTPVPPCTGSVPSCTPQYHRVHPSTIVYTPVPPCTGSVPPLYHRLPLSAPYPLFRSGWLLCHRFSTLTPSRSDRLLPSARITSSTPTATGEMCWLLSLNILVDN